MSKRILVVDPEENDRIVLSSELTNEGFDVEMVADYSQAIEKLRKDNQFDLIITELIGNKDDRWSFISDLKSGVLRKVYSVMVLTGFSDLKNAIKSRNAGSNDFVSKPYDLVDLVTTIGRVLDVAALDTTAETMRKASRN